MQEKHRAQRAIYDAITELGRLLPGAEPEVQTRITRNILAKLAVVFSQASVGVCSMDGKDLRYVGREDGLYVCCLGDPEHCWKVS